MNKLNLGEQLIKDESIEKYEYHEYTPIAGNQLNTSGEITFTINGQNLFLDISESYLVFKGQLTKTDNTAPDKRKTDTAEQRLSLTNNGIMFLFQSIGYQLNGQSIEYINNLGETTTMLGLLKYSEGFEKTMGMNQLWCRERSWNGARSGMDERFRYIVEDSNPTGYFSFAIPLKHIFGFCDTYEQVLYGFNHTLNLSRKSEDKDCVMELDINVKGRTIGWKMSAAGKVRLDKLSWFIPHVTPALDYKVKLLKQIENKVKYEVGYKIIQSASIFVPQIEEFDWQLGVKSMPEKPRYIIIGFQTKTDTFFNKATFQNVNLKNIFAYLDARRYPEVDYEINFKKNQFSRVFKEAVSFKKKYYNLDQILSDVNLTNVEYNEFYPLFVIDVSNQVNEIKSVITNITIKAYFTESVPPNTTAYATIISDRVINFEADGSNMRAVS